MNTQNTSHELRVLNATEVDAVSGAFALVDMGLFGTLVFKSDGGVIWDPGGRRVVVAPPTPK